MIVRHDRLANGAEIMPFGARIFESVDISDNGEVFAFAADGQVYRYERSANGPTLVSADRDGNPADGISEQVSLSGDGRLLAFRSTARNLAPGDVSSVADIVVHDAVSGRVERVSVAADGTEADAESKHPSLAGDGSAVAFVSRATNLSRFGHDGRYQVYVKTLASR